MALPVDGYATTSVTYSLATSNNLTVTVQVGTDSEARREAAEEFLPYLEAALNDLRANYQNGTSPSQQILYIERAYGGDVRDSL